MLLTRDRTQPQPLTAAPPVLPVALTDRALNLAADISSRYGISSTQALTRTCQNLRVADEITVAVLGRFKAGKSSFLNDFLGRDLLPVGVVPVTAIVTEIAYGPFESAEVHHLDNRIEMVPLHQVRSFVAESENPENVKQVARLSIDLPELRRFEGLRFVDTPGLESTLIHNTQASRDWLPNAGLALVAISVDPPLSEQDIRLIETLYNYTPNVSLLLTKTDMLTQSECREVIEFIRVQLNKRLGKIPEILRYSIRPGNSDLKSALERKFSDTLAAFNVQRTAILRTKVDTLLRECAGYLSLALRAAETKDSERQELDRIATAEREAITDITSEFHLIVQHAASGTRSRIAAVLEKHQSDIEKHLAKELEVEFPNWTASLAIALDSYQEWLTKKMIEQVLEISLRRRTEFLEPLHRTAKQITRSLQAFRDRLSDHTERAFGIPLRTTEPDISVEEPAAPDIRIGRVFDRNWELLSPVLPMRLLRGILLGHFRRKLSFLVYTNLSRLASQWEDTITVALRTIEKDAGKRINDLIQTVESLLSTDTSQAVQLRENLSQIAELRQAITEASPQNHAN